MVTIDLLIVLGLVTAIQYFVRIPTRLPSLVRVTRRVPGTRK